MVKRRTGLSWLVVPLVALILVGTSCQFLEQVPSVDIGPEGGQNGSGETGQSFDDQSTVDRSPRIRQAEDIPPTWTPPAAVRSETPITPEAAATVQAGGQVTYTVQPGDTLAEIAIRFNVTLEALAAANGIEDLDYIEAGQVLTIPQ
jgi:LysM repeat protein